MGGSGCHRGVIRPAEGKAAPDATRPSRPRPGSASNGDPTRSRSSDRAEPESPIAEGSQHSHPTYEGRPCTTTSLLKVSVLERDQVSGDNDG